MYPFDPLDPDHHDPPPTRGQAIGAAFALAISFGLVAAFLVFAIDRAFSAPAPPETTTPPTSILPEPTVPEPTIDISTFAVATAPAHRVAPPTTEEARVTPDCAAIVNGLTYRYGDLDPVRIAYRVAASCAGGRAPWPAEIIARWEAFIVDDVIRGESGGCPQLRGGADLSTTGIGHPCLEIDDAGRGPDSGFGQLIAVWWDGPGTPVCDTLGLCNGRAIIVSPWWSMRALLVAVEHDGKRPWCYDARARSWHPTCAVTPRRWPA